MISTRLVQFFEQKFSPQAPLLKNNTHYTSCDRSLKDGAKVVVVGGGISGSIFSRYLLMLSEKNNIDLRITLINSSNCNYCGGLITGIAQQTMAELFDLDVPDSLVLDRVSKCVYINQAGHTTIDLRHSLVATLRTSRFGIAGFDDSIKERITKGMSEATADKLTIFEPTIVTDIQKNQDAPLWTITLSRKNPDDTPVKVEADLVIMATGFRSLGRPMMKEFQKVTGYQPPKMMPASVTEVDTSSASRNLVQKQMFIIDGIVPGAIVAFIPKSPNWLTLTSLGKKLGKQDIDLIFNHPSVKSFIDLKEASNNLRCQTICGAKVYTSASPKFYGDGWVAIGDLTGYGRVLKDGYFASFLGAWHAALTIVYHGIKEADFKKFYHQPIKYFTRDNIFGIKLFKLNLKLTNYPRFNRLLIEVNKKEQSRISYGGFLNSAFRALASGELNYRLISIFFIVGILLYTIRHPISTIKIFFSKDRDIT